MKINSSGKEISLRLLPANCHISPLRFSFSSSFYLSVCCPFSVHPMYLLTEECSAFLSEQANKVSVNLQNQTGLFVVMQYLVLGVAALWL
jgi:hypothetical protein